MPSNAPVPPPDREKLCSFLRGLPPSTCSRAMPIAVINSARSCTPCRNENPVTENLQQESEEKAARHSHAQAIANCGHGRLRRNGGAKHEALAGSAHRARSSCRRGLWHYRFQCDQDPPGFSADGGAHLRRRDDGSE